MYVKHTHIVYVFRGGDALFLNSKSAVIFHKYESDTTILKKGTFRHFVLLATSGRSNRITYIYCEDN